MLDVKYIYIYIYVVVIILNVLIFVYYIITNNSLKKSIKNIGGSNDGYVTGPFSNTPPKSGASTFKINVPIKGNYILNISASAITRDVQMIALGIWINGVLTKYRLKKWGNETGDKDSNGNPGGSHQTLIPISFKYALNEGDNLIYLQHVKNIATDASTSYSDANDFASINWIYSP